MLFDCSSGIEPFFALAYRKENIMGGESLFYLNPYLEKALRARGFYSEELMEDIVKTGTIAHRLDLPDDIRRVFVGAMDISAEDHIRMQAAFQKYVDNSISKTINFPQTATREDVFKGYMLAWELGCKGCTVYRDGSRQEQVLSLNTKKETKTESSSYGMHILEPRPRPEALQGTTYKIKTAYGNLYITINEDEYGPFEVFSQMGKAGGFFAANLEAICRLVSLCLRSGVHIDSVIRQLKGIRDPQPIWYKGEMVLSLPDAIGQILEKHMKRSQSQLNLQWREEKKLNEPIRFIFDNSSGDNFDPSLAPACPDCGSFLQFQDGCMKCPVCGFSRCG
jgi:ribonucleoside-diphosphate reductase alpha chain